MCRITTRIDRMRGETLHNSKTLDRALRSTTLFVPHLVLVLSIAVLVLVLGAFQYSYPSYWSASSREPVRSTIGSTAVRTAIEYEYRFTEYRFAEYEYDEIRGEARTPTISGRPPKTDDIKTRDNGDSRSPIGYRDLWHTIRHMTYWPFRSSILRFASALVAVACSASDFEGFLPMGTSVSGLAVNVVSSFSDANFPGAVYSLRS